MAIPKMPKERQLEMIEKIGIQEFNKSSTSEDNNDQSSSTSYETNKLKYEAMATASR